MKVEIKARFVEEAPKLPKLAQKKGELKSMFLNFKFHFCFFNCCV